MLLAAFKGHELEAVVTVALATGMRPGELLGLEWEDVDLDAGTVRVHRQLKRVGGCYELVDLQTERSNRALALPVIAITALRSHRTSQAGARLLLGPEWKDGGLVFTTADGDYLNGSAVTHRFQDRLRAYGLAVRSFRAAPRRRFAAAGSGRHDADSQSQISLTMNTYAHIAPQLLRDAADRLDQALGG